MIPFVKTDLGEEEKKAISDCIDSGWVVLGKKSEEFEHKFAEYVGAKYAVFVDSGTSALFLSLQNFKKNLKTLDSQVIVPSLTFTATAEAAINAGYTIKFADVSKEDFCMIPPESYRWQDILLPVHLTGNKSKLDALIYDSAHRIEKDDVKESFAMSLWCYSFYATKNMTTVQGGMICTNNKIDYEWLKMARDHGLDMGTKERYTGKYKQYDVKFVGWRVKGDDLRAVIGLEQLKKLPRMTERRNELVGRYNDAFGLNRTGNHVYPIFVNDRDKFMDYMIKHDVQCTVHFKPLHTMTGYKQYYHGKPLPNTEWIGEHIVSIPLYPQLTNDEQEYIIKTVMESACLIK